MKGNPLSMNLYSDFHVRIKDDLVSFEGIRNKVLYWEMIYCTEPSSLTTWVDMFPFLEMVSWTYDCGQLMQGSSTLFTGMRAFTGRKPLLVGQ